MKIILIIVSNTHILLKLPANNMSGILPQFKKAADTDICGLSGMQNIIQNIES